MKDFVALLSGISFPTAYYLSSFSVKEQQLICIHIRDIDYLTDLIKYFRFLYGSFHLTSYPVFNDFLQARRCVVHIPFHTSDIICPEFLPAFLSYIYIIIHPVYAVLKKSILI